MRVGSLFSGIGGFDLGFERAGMRTVWFCEQDKFCQRVLEKHWPGVPCHDDVCLLNAGNVEPVDVLCGGFPCQDLSVAGKGAGLDGARSGLWSEYARLIGELRPRYVVVENVSALLARGLGRVLGDLAALGYDAEWDCLPASAFGAPHRRDRIWLVAYSGRGRVQPDGKSGELDGTQRETREALQPEELSAAVGSRGEDVADAGCARLEGRGTEHELRSAPWTCTDLGSGGWWRTEPDVGRVAYGVPARVDRLRSLGNALVPQIAEWIGHRIVEWERLSADR